MSNTNNPERTKAFYGKLSKLDNKSKELSQILTKVLRRAAADAAKLSYAEFLLQRSQAMLDSTSKPQSDMLNTISTDDQKEIIRDLKERITLIKSSASLDTTLIDAKIHGIINTIKESRKLAHGNRSDEVKSVEKELKECQKAIEKYQKNNYGFAKIRNLTYALDNLESAIAELLIKARQLGSATDYSSSESYFAQLAKSTFEEIKASLDSLKTARQTLKESPSDNELESAEKELRIVDSLIRTSLSEKLYRLFRAFDYVAKNSPGLPNSKVEAINTVTTKLYKYYLNLAGNQFYDVDFRLKRDSIDSNISSLSELVATESEIKNLLKYF